MGLISVNIEMLNYKIVSALFKPYLDRHHVIMYIFFNIIPNNTNKLSCGKCCCFTFVCEDLLVCLQIMVCRQTVIKLVQNRLSFNGNQ